MRILSSQEIARIDQRLESLKIQYLEILHELRDHYFTELEKKSNEEFEATFQQLNETFAWSVVKKMERQAGKASEKQINEMRWEMLKFWKPNNPDFYITPLSILLILPMFILFDVEGVTLMMGIVGILGIPVSWMALVDKFKFIPKRLSFQFDTALSYQLYNKSGFFIGGALLILVAINNWNSSNPGMVGRIMIWIIAIPHLLYYLTLIRVALNWKYKKLRKTS
jgi:hypothetical protein